MIECDKKQAIETIFVSIACSPPANPHKHLILKAFQIIQIRRVLW